MQDTFAHYDQSDLEIIGLVPAVAVHEQQIAPSPFLHIFDRNEPKVLEIKILTNLMIGIIKFVAIATEAAS